MAIFTGSPVLVMIFYCSPFIVIPTSLEWCSNAATIFLSSDFELFINKISFARIRWLRYQHSCTWPATENRSRYTCFPSKRASQFYFKSFFPHNPFYVSLESTSSNLHSGFAILKNIPRYFGDGTYQTLPKIELLAKNKQKLCVDMPAENPVLPNLFEDRKEWDLLPWPPCFLNSWKDVRR